MRDLKNSSIRGALWSAFENATARGVTLVSFLVLARILGAEAFGIVAIAGVYVSFLELVVRVGFTEAIVQHPRLTEAHKNSAFCITGALGLLCLTLSFALAPLVARITTQPELKLIIIALALGTIPLSLTRVQEGLLLRDMNFRVLAIRQTFAAISGAAAGIVMAITGCGVWSLVGQQLTTRIVECIVLYWLTNWRPSLAFDSGCARELITYGSRVFGTNFVDFFSKESDKLIVGHLFGPYVLGIYVVGQRLVSVIRQSLRSVFNRVILSLQSKLQFNLADVRNAYTAVLGTTALISVPVFSLLAIHGDIIVPVVFGSKWLASGTICQIFGIAGLVTSLTLPAMPTLKAIGYPGLALNGVSLRAAMAPLLMISLSPLGIHAVAWACVVGECLLVVFFSYWLHNKLDFPPLRALRLFLPATTATSMGAAVLMGSYIWLPELKFNVLLLLATTTAYFVAYAACLVLAFPNVARRLRALVAGAAAQAKH